MTATDPGAIPANTRQASFPNIQHFVRAYLHQDYDLDYGDIEAAMDAFIEDSSADQRRATRAELQELLSVWHDEDDRHRIVIEETRADVDPHLVGETVTDYLRKLARRLDAAQSVAPRD